LGKKFCISGGLSNVKLAMNTPAEVRDECKRILDGVAGDGGYIFDASAIIQNDAQIENVKAMTEAVRKFGQYRTATTPPPVGPVPEKAPVWRQTQRAPGACIPWAEKLKELPRIQGDAELVKRIWEDVDGLAYVYAWHCLVSFYILKYRISGLRIYALYSGRWPILAALDRSNNRLNSLG